MGQRLDQDAEAYRLAQLRDLLVLDSPPEAVFDKIAQMASAACGTPIALISLVDDERQWFKANVGLTGVGETSRSVSFCAHAIVHDELFEVPDALNDPRFSSNPLVLGTPWIRFYAGVPLVLRSGARMGTLCVIDHQARRLDSVQTNLLRDLAELATQTLEMRRDLIRRSLSVRSEYENALFKSEARHRALADGQREIVLLARTDGAIVYANPASCSHFGCAAGALTPSRWIDLISPEDRERALGALELLLQTGDAGTFACRTLQAAEDCRWVRWSCSLQPDPQEEQLIQLIGDDITEQGRAEKALRASEAFLDRTGRIAGVGGWAFDLRDNSIFWSDQTCRIHEVAPGHRPTFEEAIGFFAPPGRERIQAVVNKGIRSGEPWDVELPMTTAAGRSIWVRAVGEVEFEHGKAVRLFGAFQDVTERYERQEALRQEQASRLNTERHAHELQGLLRERNEMLDVLAHEVRQPLNNASAALQSAALTLAGIQEDTASSRLGRAQRVMGQVLARIDNTLAVASLLARADPIEREDTDVNALLAVAIADMPSTEQCRIRIERETMARTASMDMSLMRLALRNLLANALTYGPADSPVTIAVKDSDEPLALVIEVSDHGSGVDASLRPRLFQRGEHRQTHCGAGLGLGLYIVRRVMELHGGRVDLVLDRPTTTFRLVIEQTQED